MLIKGIIATSCATATLMLTVGVVVAPAQAGTLVVGKMTYTESGKTVSNKWTGDYTFMVHFDAATSKITMSQVSGPDKKQNGWYTVFSGTQAADGTVTFDAKKVDYFEKPKPPENKAIKYGSGSFKGSFKDTDKFLEFEHITDGNKNGGIWNFTTKPTDPTPPPFMSYDDPVLPPFASTSTPEPTSTIGLLALGTLGAATTLKRQLKPTKSAEKETTKVG